MNQTHPHSVCVPELQDEVFAFPDDTHRSFLWVSVKVRVSVGVRGEGSEVRGVLGCYDCVRLQGQRSKVSRHLRVGLLLLLLADERLESLNSVRTDAEI